MRKIIFIFFVFLPLFLFARYMQVGTDSTIDVMTWNIENFPKDDGNTVSEVEEIITDLDVDLIGVQEIASVDDFNRMLDDLPGWSGILSPHEYSSGSYQKIGLIYNEQKVTVISWQLLFEGDTYAFPRPPMEFTLDVNESGHEFDFKLIVVHLKAYEDQDSEDRRKAAVDSLKKYIDEQLALGGEQDFVLLGDFNDHLEDPPEDNIFQPMLNDSDTYHFLTQWLTGIQGSYIGYNEPNLIDHICITEDALNEYGSQGFTQVLYLNNENTAYESTVSDHRPVLAQFAFENQPAYTPLADIHNHFNSYNQRMVKVKGVVTIGAGILSSAYTSVYIQDQSDAGMNIYYADTVVSDFQQGTEVQVVGQEIDYNGLHELKYYSHQVLATNRPLPEPFTISSNSINNVQADPGRWVTVEGTIESISGSGNISMMVNDGSGAGKIFFDADAGLNISGFSVGDEIRVTGVKTVYNNEGEVEPGYQTDIEHAGPSVCVEDDPLPPKPALFQNHPNPFNPVTVIGWQIAVGSYVELTVYNLSGQKVQTLIKQSQHPGMHTAVFNAAGLSSGVYLYRLKVAGQKPLNGRMLLIR